MPKAAKNKPPKASNELVCGLFTRKEAAEIIASGSAHVHSSALAVRDTNAKVTLEILNGQKVPYPWELQTSAELSIQNSSERQKTIDRVVSSLANLRRDSCDKLKTVLEELISNAIFHSYSNVDGTPKYPRQKAATLSPKEEIKIHFGGNKEGIFISVMDNGGSLFLPTIQDSFNRCYGESTSQIEDKQGGAGLGIYMVFEIATHMKIETMPGEKTLVSCWISEPRYSDPNYFSFNFFDGGSRARKR